MQDKKEKIQMTNIRNEEGDITIVLTVTKYIINNFMPKIWKI